MNPEKTYLYKNEHRAPAYEAPMRGKRTKNVSESRKRADHKHVYRKVILHYGGSAFAWGGQCEICSRLDTTFKASACGDDLKVRGTGRGGSWEDICLAEMHERYPEHKLMTLVSGKWREWMPPPTKRGVR